MTSEDADSLDAVKAMRAVVEEEAVRTETAVLRPDEPGGLEPAERLAFATRIARFADNYRLAACYEEQLTEIGASAELREIASGFEPVGPRLAALTRHVDLITVRPTDAAAHHIASLREAGIGDADIVRLSELISFVNYRARTEAAIQILDRVR